MSLVQRFRSAGLLAQFLIVGVTVGLVTAAAIAWFVDAQITSLVLNQVAQRATDQVKLGVISHLNAQDFEPPFTAARLDLLSNRLDGPLSSILENDGVLRLHLFALDGTVIYSDLTPMRGKKIAPAEDSSLDAALHGVAVTQISDLRSQENAELHATFGTALEVYVPVVLDGHVVGAYEVYQDAAPLRLVRPLVWGSMALGAAVLLSALTLVVRRAARLIQRQQEEQRRLAQTSADREASREMDIFRRELLGTVSHELRTPLSLVHGYAELLSERGHTFDAESMREMAQEIHRGSTTMRRMVEDLLDLSRIQRGRLDMLLVDTHLDELVREALPRLRELPGGERLEARIESTPPCRVDPKHFEHMMTNLVMNGLSYAPEGEVLLQLKHPIPGWASVEVVDHGPGMAPEVLARVWDSFYRAPDTMTSPRRGAGVGLAVVKSLAEAHGGYVEAETTQGSGSTFRVYLPCMEELPA